MSVGALRISTEVCRSHVVAIRIHTEFHRSHTDPYRSIWMSVGPLWISTDSCRSHTDPHRGPSDPDVSIRISGGGSPPLGQRLLLQRGGYPSPGAKGQLQQRRGGVPLLSIVSQKRQGDPGYQANSSLHFHQFSDCRAILALFPF